MDFRNNDVGAGTVVVEPLDGSPQRQVYFVNEAEEIRDFIVWLLRSGGYRAIAARDESLVRSLLSTGHPVLVITDIEMPICRDAELLVFCHSQLPETPVMVVLRRALAKTPSIRGWISEISANSYGASNFQMEIRAIVSQSLNRKGKRSQG